MAQPYIEKSDGWYAPSMRGSGIGRVVLDDAVTLHLGSDSVVIRAPLLLDAAGVVTEQVPGDPARLALVASLLGTVCRSLRWESSGQLRFDGADGRCFTVAPVPQFSAWELFVRGSDLVACRPGGGFDRWDGPRR